MKKRTKPIVHCLICTDEVDRKTGEFLYLQFKPKESEAGFQEVWLCGSQSCEDKFNGD